LNCNRDKQISESQNKFSPLYSLPTNSYNEYFKNTEINYFYNENAQIHDYSNNWDIDGDGISDKIQFWGNNATNLKFYLLIYLSTTNEVYFFNYLIIEFPKLENFSSIEKYKESRLFPGFVVYDYSKDNLNDILLKIERIDDNQPNKFGIKTNNIIINFDKKNKKLIINDFND
jgi:hypothetical protein